MNFTNFESENTQPAVPNIPKITTRETDKLRDQYPSLSHLEGGNIAEWLQERKDQLFEQARTAEMEADTTRVLGLASAAIGTICYAINPFMVIGGMIGGAAWLWFLIEHYNRTKEIAPLPFVRGNFLDALNRAGDYDARRNYQADHLTDTVKFLPRHHAEEYAFIYSDRNFETITQYLQQVEPGKRFYAYRWLFGWFVKLKGKQIPTQDTMLDHLQHVTIDSRVKVEEVKTIAQSNEPFQLPETQTVDINQFALPTVDILTTTEQKITATPIGNDTKLNAIDTKATSVQQIPDKSKLLGLPLEVRATAIIEALNRSGFDLAKCIQDQITIIAGNQRGGKGTLMAILAILSKALEPQTKIHYFTAGDDIYPFKCDQLVCRLNYPSLSGDKADAKVALSLYKYLQEMDNASQNEYKDIILVVDETVALSGYLDDDQKQWIIRFIFTRANKKGAQIFIVLHGKNLTSWVGTRNTAGFADTFKSGATFIGCEATSLKLSPLKSISVATGRYFLADPDSFEKAVTNGEIGIIPDWMKTEINPATGQPDPARTLLNFFPELLDENPQLDMPIEYEGKISDAINNLENSFKLQTEVINSPEVEQVEQEQDTNSTKLSEPAQLVLSFFDNAKNKLPKSIKELKDANKLRPLDDSTLLMALRELVVEQRLTFDAEGRYLKIDWQ
ncbi:hypothetical protein [Iningainema tapete]|uniref:Uncharacterized protein n=1 Tax=Iningainema tapete BLCC-T55 TaxID=2748662 RepID=A0A8J7BVW4_9CYAN|nr:hypothetical protein [Iningainema tapete]MBD2770657.1 hypothetical protein [Iningainema tapete BLCC-T55]